MNTNEAKANEQLHDGWRDPNDVPSQFISTPMNIILLLVDVDAYDHPVLGWKFESIGWRIDGSPSTWWVNYWQPLPTKRPKQ